MTSWVSDVMSLWVNEVVISVQTAFNENDQLYECLNGVEWYISYG